MTRNEPPGFDPALHDADFFTWTQRQAAALRAMPGHASLDVKHVAEEIEDLGKRDLREVVSFLVLVLQHVIKLHVAPASRDAAHWYQETSNFQASARRAFSPGMRQLIDLDEVWADAWQGVRRFLDDSGTDEDHSDEPCPFTLDEMLARPFDIDAAVERLSIRGPRAPWRSATASGDHHEAPPRVACQDPRGSSTLEAELHRDLRTIGSYRMSWHVRFFSPSLQQDLLSPELATKEEAMREAWTLAEQGEDVTAVEGPDGELVSTDEIELWAKENAEPSAPSIQG